MLGFDFEEEDTEGLDTIQLLGSKLNQPHDNPSPKRHAETDASSDQPVSKKPRLLDFEEEEAHDINDLPALHPLPSLSVRELDIGISPAIRHANTSVTVCGKTFDGNTVTFKRKSATPFPRSDRLEQFKTSSKRLLQQPMHRLLAEIEQERKESIAKQEALMQQRTLLTEANLTAAEKGKAKESDLWTDRYRPKKFVDLVGDDRVNRAAMAWLKEWDACVFKSSAAALERRRQSAAKRRKDREAQAAKFGMPTTYTEQPEDPWLRPHEKVLLLSGPPGLGKTTLAHVLARQAGYQVHEINASDDRSARVVTDRIREALESRAITASSFAAPSATTAKSVKNKPTCVIIDEIDGASGGGDFGFIKTLVKFIVDGSKVPKKGGKQKKEHKPLMRPIICICNDLYAPVLRPLRPLAKLLKFNAPTNASLIQRIKTICEQEGLHADSKSLSALVSIAEGDLRTCLNTLQFINTQTKHVDEQIIRSTALGLKDTGTSPAAVWDRLFRVPYNRKGKNDTQGNSHYIDRLVKDIATCGEYDKLVQGCFEYYLLAKFPTDGWKSIHRGLDWLQFYDRIDASLRADRNFELLPYLPFTFVPWYPLFAHVGNKSVEWPKADYEAYLKKMAHQEIGDALHKNVPTHLKMTFNAKECVTELAPALMRIVSPDIKLIGTQVAKPEQLPAFEKLIKLMTTFSLLFLQDQNEEGQMSFKIEPPIDVFVHYEGKRPDDIAQSRFAFRQLVAQRASMENGSTQEHALASSSADQILNAYKSATLDGEGKKDVASVKTVTLDARAHVRIAQAGAVDFFGRTKLPLSLPVPMLVQQGTGIQEDSPETPVVHKQLKVTYRYHEGSSTAVKVPIKVAQLFSR